MDQGDGAPELNSSETQAHGHVNRSQSPGPRFEGYSYKKEVEKIYDAYTLKNSIRRVMGKVHSNYTQLREREEGSADDIDIDPHTNRLIEQAKREVHDDTNSQLNKSKNYDAGNVIPEHEVELHSPTRKPRLKVAQIASNTKTKPKTREDVMKKVEQIKQQAARKMAEQLNKHESDSSNSDDDDSERLIKRLNKSRHREKSKRESSSQFSDFGDQEDVAKNIGRQLNRKQTLKGGNLRHSDKNMIRQISRLDTLHEDAKNPPLRVELAFGGRTESAQTVQIGSKNMASPRERFKQFSAQPQGQNQFEIKLNSDKILSARFSDVGSPNRIQSSASMQSSQFICDQNYTLPYEHTINMRKVNFGERCFNEGKGLIHEMLMRRGEKDKTSEAEKNSRQRAGSQENELTQEDDPFDMNVIFYDGETPINDFKSREEFVDRELALENGGFANFQNQKKSKANF